MAYSNSAPQQLQLAVQESLQDIAVQLGKPITSKTAQQLCQETIELLSHLDYAPITLARVAGTLLALQSQAEPEEQEWFRNQIRESTDAEAVEELIESINREAL